MQRFAVIDTETTGFGKNDRLVEIAVLIVEDGKIVDEWETLINPGRDISNSSIHGITPDLVSLAPTFAEIEPTVSKLIDGAFLVAHNLAFDKRMLEQEFSWLQKNIDLGSGFCTLQATKLKLEAACEKYGVTNLTAHRAYTDARAAAQIFIKICEDIDFLEGITPICVNNDVQNKSVRLLTRSAVSQEHALVTPNLRRIINNLGPSIEMGSDLSYLDALSSVMSDFEITVEETSYLNDWAETLGIPQSKQVELHNSFLDQLIMCAQKDSYVSETENSLIEKAARALGITLKVEGSLQGPNVVSTFHPGTRVCFTGKALDKDGLEIFRETLEAYAKEISLIPVSTVTKKACDLLVAADKSSTSGKTKKARDFGIQVISVSEFLELIS